MIKPMFLWISMTLMLTVPRAATSAARLDQEAVHRYYNDGDFDPAIALLEDFQKSHSRFTRAESVAVYKYLGVMYCADQRTREKGKTYFYKLLKVDPTAKILDMYVSIMVQEIFKSTLEELMGQTSEQAPSPAAGSNGMNGKSAETPVASNPPKRETRTAAVRESDGRTLYWWMGGLGLAAGVAGGLYIYSQSGHHGSETDIPITP